jgi:hypothetical protein
MKLVKLDRRHRAYKEFGHTWAFRWNHYDLATCPKVEKIMNDLHGSQWNYRTTPKWQSRFGEHGTHRRQGRTYWISFLDEQDTTIVLLKMSALSNT